jgi:hypothetical protein
LYSDSFALLYLFKITELSLNTFSFALSNAIRSDICDFFRDRQTASSDLHDKLLKTFQCKRGLLFKLDKDLIAKTLVTGFVQVAQSKDILKFLIKGKKIASRQIDLLCRLSKESEYDSTRNWKSALTIIALE